MKGNIDENRSSHNINAQDKSSIPNPRHSNKKLNICIENAEDNENLPCESKFLKITPKQNIINQYINFYETWKMNEEAPLEIKKDLKETDMKEENINSVNQINLYHKTKPKKLSNKHLDHNKNDTTFNVNNIEKLEEYLLSPTEKSFTKSKQDNEYISTNDNQTQDQVDIKSNSIGDSAKLKQFDLGSSLCNKGHNDYNKEAIISNKEPKKKETLPIYLKSPLNKSANVNKPKNKLISSTPKQINEKIKTNLERKTALNKEIGNTISENKSRTKERNKAREFEVVEIPHKIFKIQSSETKVNDNPKISNIKQSFTVKNHKRKEILSHNTNKR